MSQYRRIEMRGKSRFMFRHGPGHRWTMHSEAKLPDKLIARLRELPIGVIYDDAVTEDKPEPTLVYQDRSCIYCGEPGTCIKYIFSQMVYLCDEDYQNRTTGEIGQKVRELQGGTNAQS